MNALDQPTSRRGDHTVRSILYVEDNADTRDVVSTILACDGYRVITAATLAEGLHAVQKLRFDLVITDYHLPDGTGATLVARGRRSGALARTPLLLVTSWPKLPRLPGVTVVRKPFSADELLDKVGFAIAGGGRRYFQR